MSARHRLQAWKELFQHYGAVFLHFWTLRHTMRTDFFNKEEAEFLPAGLALKEAPDSPTLRWTGRILIAIIGFTLLWAIFGRVDIIVNATGKVIPSARTKTIASVDTASVSALHVIEGQVVRAGDVLLELNSSSSDAEHDKAMKIVEQGQLQVARSIAMLESIAHLKSKKLGVVPGVSEEKWKAEGQYLEGLYRDFYSKLIRINGEVTRYSSELLLAKQRADDYKELLQDSIVSHHAWLEKEQVRLDLQGQLEDVKNQKVILIAQARKEALDALMEGNRIIATSEQDQRRAGEHSKLLKLVAPIDGTVQQLMTHTIGGVVPAAQSLMQIVPTEQVVEIEAFVANKDIGFIQVGQDVSVKIDAYEYTKYGTIKAKIKHVSQDAIEDEKKGLIYLIKIALDKSSIFVDGNALRLSAGMSVNVDIRTGTRRVIGYVLSPLLRHQKEAFHER